MSLKRRPNGGRRMSKRRYLLKVEIKGPGVRPRSISVPELLKICDGIQTAVHRQAEAIEGRRTLRPGPRIATAHEECTLELFALGKGSTTLIFRLAKPQQPLPLPDYTTFGAEVVASVAEIVRKLGKGRGNGPTDVDPGVLDSLSKLGEVFDKRSISNLTLAVPRHNGKPSVRAVFNRTVRERVVERIKAPTEEMATVEGILEMADFKEQGKVCRIHPPVGQAIQCTFEPEREDEVYLALRKPVRLSGVAKINPNTGRKEELKIETIEVIEQLLVGSREFFTSRSLEEMAMAQGVGPLTNPAVLAGGWPDDDDLDKFLEETYHNRSV